MDNQHKKISGYRDLTQGEIDLINAMKEKEAELGTMMTLAEAVIVETNDREAGRWLSLARTHLETGMMFAIKAIARPTNGLGRRNPQ